MKNILLGVTGGIAAFKSASIVSLLKKKGYNVKVVMTKKNIEKRYIIHIAGFNLGILLRALFGFGSPRGWADAGAGLIFVRIGNLNLLILVIWLPNVADTPDCVMMVIMIEIGRASCRERV